MLTFCRKENVIFSPHILATREEPFRDSLYFPPALAQLFCAGLTGSCLYSLPAPGVGVSAGGADLLLDVEGDLAAAVAQRVRLVAALAERARPLRLGQTQNSIIVRFTLILKARGCLGRIFSAFGI